MAMLHLREEMKAQMANLSEKYRELESRLQETKDFTVRLSRLVVCVVEGFMNQSQELLFIKFLLTSILFRARSDGPDVPPKRAWIRGCPFHHYHQHLLLVGFPL